jgi:hypothetical protein
MERNLLKERLLNKDDKNRHFVLLIIDINKHGAKEITNKQEPKQQKSTATIVYTVIQHFHNSMT